MGLFKRAAARGVAYELVRNGIVAFPSKEAMDEAADAVADSPAAEGMPEMSGEGGHSPEELSAVAQKLMEIAHALMEQAGAAAPGAGGMPPEMHPEGSEAAGMPPPSPEAAKMSMDLTKTAAESDYQTVAAESAVACMDKAAAEVKQATSGALIHGGDKGNDASQAAAVGEVAALDKKQRPEGAYHHGVGKTELDTIGGLIGDMSKHPKGPANSPSGSNSVSQDAGSASKQGSLDAELKKIANKLVGLHDGTDKNKLTDSAKIDTVAQLDNKNRPQGKYLVGVGNANFSEPQTHRIGHEEPHPNAPKNSPSGTNSVMQASKTSEEEAFVVLFKKTAEDVGPYLPRMSDDEKVAHITKMIGYDHDGRQEYLNGLHKTAGADESKESKKHEKGESAKYEKKEEKDETKKESALLGRIREIAASSASAS